MQKEYYVGDHVVTPHHTAFFVANLEESVQFYQEVFGFESCKQKSIAEMKKVPQNLHS